MWIISALGCKYIFSWMGDLLLYIKRFAVGWSHSLNMHDDVIQSDIWMNLSFYHDKVKLLDRISVFTEYF